MPSKKTFMLSSRLEEEFATVMQQLRQLHRVDTMSDFLRGLVYLDATHSGVPTNDLDRPAWIIKAYPELFPEAPRFRKPLATKGVIG
jgi:hypothetical protein